MHTDAPPELETFSHWPSWLNARGHVDRSACLELKVSEVRRLAGCVPMRVDTNGNTVRAKGRALYGVADLPNERRAVNGKGRRTVGWFDVDARTLVWLMDGRLPRRLGGDWRTGRAPAMRGVGAHAARGVPDSSSLRSSATACGGVESACAGMGLEQGGYGPGSYAYEQGGARALGVAMDVGLTGNPNGGASREKQLGLDDAWVQRVWLEKWDHASVSGVQYFLLCPGCRDVGSGAEEGVGEVLPCADVGAGEAARLGALSARPRLSGVDAKGLKGLTGTTSNCGDGSRGAHGRGWLCGERVYKLFWVLARPGEVRDALLAEQWIAGLSSGQLARCSAVVSALVERYGAVMGTRALRCRRCLRLRYGQSPEVLRRKRAYNRVSTNKNNLA